MGLSILICVKKTKTKKRHFRTLGSAIDYAKFDIKQTLKSILRPFIHWHTHSFIHPIPLSGDTGRTVSLKLTTLAWIFLWYFDTLFYSPCVRSLTAIAAKSNFLTYPRYTLQLKFIQRCCTFFMADAALLMTKANKIAQGNVNTFSKIFCLFSI